MKEKDIVVLSNVSDLRKFGTTNFFKLLYENRSASGVVKIFNTDTYIRFRYCVLDKDVDIKNLATVTKFLQKLSQGVLSAVKENNIIRAEIEKADFRSKSNPKTFTVKLEEISREKYEKMAKASNAIQYNQSYALDYSALEVEITNSKVEDSTPTGGKIGNVKSF